MVKTEFEVTNLQCVCKREIKDKVRPDLKAINCRCAGFDKKGVERIFKVTRFVQIIKRGPGGPPR